VDDIAAQVLPSAISVAGILAAFQMTGMTLLLVLVDTPTVKVLRQSGYFDLLMGYFWTAARTLWLFVGLAIAMLAVTACKGSLSAHERLVPALLAASFTLAVAASLRMNRLMVKLLLNKGDPSRQTPPGP
jgi:hypothetical protein